MITSVEASLSITGGGAGDRTSAITELLGIEPTEVWEFGDPWPMRTRPDRVHRFTGWVYVERRTIADAEDPHGMESLVRLAERFEPLSAQLESLSKTFEIRVRMLGFSDSSQGGFYVGPETMRRLGALHAAFVPDVYLGEELYESALADLVPSSTPAGVPADRHPGESRAEPRA